MCWSEEISWTTFLIGTSLNLWNFYTFSRIKNGRTMILLSIFWQWILFMQFFEAFLWRSYKNGDDNCMWATKMATMASMTQPILIGLLLLIDNPSNLNLGQIRSGTILNLDSNNFFAGKTFGTNLISIILIFAYICYILYNLTNQTIVKSCIEPDSICQHLNLDWWKRIPGTIWIHVLTILLLLFLLLRPWPSYSNNNFKFTLIIAGYVLLTYLLSAAFYNCNGAGASMWCWFAALGPLVTRIAWFSSVPN